MNDKVLFYNNNIITMTLYTQTPAPNEKDMHGFESFIQS